MNLLMRFLSPCLMLCATALSAAEAPPPATDAVQDNAKAPAPAVRVPASAADRLELDASVVTGNRELPKVLYIVPWKKAELGDLPEQPFNTLLDEALQPVDRDEFRREVSYYSKLADKAGPDAAALKPAAKN